VIPYLEAVARHQGISVAGYGASVFRQCIGRPPLTIEQPLPPNGNEPLPTADLRRALTQMQLDRGLADRVLTPQRMPLDFLKATVAIENASWADAYIAPRDAALLEVSFLARWISKLTVRFARWIAWHRQ
jgi:hypothetical protein